MDFGWSRVGAAVGGLERADSPVGVNSPEAAAAVLLRSSGNSEDLRLSLLSTLTTVDAVWATMELKMPGVSFLRAPRPFLLEAPVNVWAQGRRVRGNQNRTNWLKETQTSVIRAVQSSHLT